MFDTVKSYGWVSNPVILRNEEDNPSVLHVRHAISIDKKRSFFRQMHWKANKNLQTCKEVWFAGDHSDVGGGYPEQESGLAKIALEWMVHEAIALDLKVNHKWYGLTFLKEKDSDGQWQAIKAKKGEVQKYARPDYTADAHESLAGPWKILQLLPKKLAHWENFRGIRTIKSGYDRLLAKEQEDNLKELNPILIHKSVIDRVKDDLGYAPRNLINMVRGNINNLTKEQIERTKTSREDFK